MVLERNKAIVRRIREEAVGRSGADLDLLDGLYAPGYRYHGGAWGELEGADAFKGLLNGLSAALQDYRERVVEEVSEGNRVAIRLTGKGRALADLPGIPGNTAFTSSAAAFIVFDDEGKIAEEWVYPGEMTPVDS